jgi:hypothetical protein
MKTLKSSRLIRRKLATAFCIGLSLAAFATLGERDGKNPVSGKKLLSYKSTSYKSFSLRSGYNYSGNNILNNTQNNRFVMLNTVVTYQKGNGTYILPLKKKILIDSRVKITPSTGSFR